MLISFPNQYALIKTYTAAGVAATPGRPLIDFTRELPPPIALAVPPGGAGGIGAKQPSTVKQDLDTSDLVLAALDRSAHKVTAITV